MESFLDEFLCDFPDLAFYLRGDSGFASLDLYEVLEDKNYRYAIRLKENTKLRELVEEEDQTLYRATKSNQVDYAAQYGDFLYQAGSWNHPRRIVFKIENLYRHNTGNGALPGDSVLLRQGQNGKFHQRRQK